MNTKRVASALLALTILLSASGCRPKSSEQASVSPAPSRPSAVEPSVSDDLPAVGEKLSGFVVTQLGEIPQLGAKTVEFQHDKSGATLLFLQNDDQNRRFSISYRTPVVDETDTNHIFEHAIIAGSKKFPSSNLFFDLASKTYNTYVNAATYPSFTTYPVSSQSEEQLIKMIDAYLSCMVAPTVLEEENIFRREALRYELESRDAPITLTGTVFSEDMGQVSDLQSNAFDAVKDALYPGLTASNSIGLAFREYQDLTYEHLKQTYERSYSFDNSLMLLYGDLDYRRILAMLDQEYLSKAENKNTDLSDYYDELVIPGNEIVTVKSPAYEGDLSEAMIAYAIDISEAKPEEWIYWDFFTTLFQHENSFWKQDLLREGITNQANSVINNFEAKPHLLFSLENAKEEQRNDFRSSIERAMHDVAKNGFAPELIESLEKTTLLSNRLVREFDQIENSVAPMIVNHWVLTGDTGYYPLYNHCLSTIFGDQDQLIFKRLAAQALAPKRSALVTTVATPGLAEQIEEEQQQYLRDKKAQMTDEQLDQMIAETKAFSEWNETAVSNSSISIPTSKLPAPPEAAFVTVSESDGITSYTTPTNTDGVGLYSIYLDHGALPQDRLFDYGLYLMLLGDLPTEQYSAEQVRQLVSESLYQCSFAQLYPEAAAGENARPMTEISWYCLTEDYEKSLALLTEVLRKTDFSDPGQVVNLIKKYLPTADLSRTQDSLTLAVELARGAWSRNKAFFNFINGQEFYHYLESTLSEMEQSPEKAKEITERLSEIGEMLLCRDRLITTAAAPEKTLGDARQAVSKVLGALPTHQKPAAAYTLPNPVRRLGVALELASQNNVMVTDLSILPGWQGRYLPFVYAADDQLLVPRIRFQMGAYSVGVSYSWNLQQLCFYTFSDPNVGASLDVFRSAGKFLKQAQLTQQEFDGYRLNAYASATPTSGALLRGNEEMHGMILGWDFDAARQAALDIKNATLADQAKAAEMIEQALDQATVVTVGNERNLNAEAEHFDQVVDYRKK